MTTELFESPAPWHAESYDRMLAEGLPALLAERVPLTGYRWEAPAGEPGVALVHLTVAGRVPLSFRLPYPDRRGVFAIGGAEVLVIPLASSEELDTAEIDCVGEQLLALAAERLGQASRHIAWDEALARAWLPLEELAAELLTPRTDDFSAREVTAQHLDRTNPLATATNLRRVVVRQPGALFAPGQVGRACLFEQPEGPNMGRIYSVARGAAVRGRRLVIAQEGPEAALGLSAGCIPLLEHDEYPRLLMGANMLRQWLPQPDPEPALVRSGLEPDLTAFWCGRNLLTAFITWGADTFEDGIVISETAARRLGASGSAEVGDKLSNRHGAMGVVSRVLPDAEMPHLPDGTPVELVYSFMGIPSRLNFGQVREAALGRVARATGRPAVAPPFGGPTAGELRALLRGAGLPEDGQETLRLGRGGPPLAQPSTAGWVYWGRLVHTAASKLRVFTGAEGIPRIVDELDEPGRTAAWPAWVPAGQLQGELEYYALRLAGALETIREQYNTRSALRPDAATLAARLAEGPVEQAGAPGPLLESLRRRLAAGGVRAELTDAGLALSFAEPEGDALRLAEPVPHPWLPERELRSVGGLPATPEHAALAEASGRLAGLLASGAPGALVRRARGQLEQAAQARLDALLSPAHLTFDQPTIFSARAAAAPGGAGLRYDEVGLADEIAWGLFGPLAARALGDAESVRRRDGRAAEALDSAMAEAWVLVGRSPSLEPHAFLAFRPVRIPERVVRLPSLACTLLDADFDGDQVAVFLPVTAAGQREAAERLSVAAHIARDPGLAAEVRPRMDSLLGLAHLSLTPEGRAEVDRAAGRPVPAPDGVVTRWGVAEALAEELAAAGPRAALDMSERLSALGFAAAARLGLSLSPFVGEGWGPPAPAGDEPERWERYAGEVEARLDAHRDFAGGLGGLVLAARSGARGNRRLLASLLATRYGVPSLYEATAPVRGNMRDGLPFAEMAALAGPTRAGMSDLNRYWERGAVALRERLAPRGDGALARAMRAARPGVVLALAAQARETDPLREPSSRLFAGLPAEG